MLKLNTSIVGIKQATQEDQGRSTGAYENYHIRQGQMNAKCAITTVYSYSGNRTQHGWRNEQGHWKVYFLEHPEDPGFRNWAPVAVECTPFTGYEDIQSMDLRCISGTDQIRSMSPRTSDGEDLTITTLSKIKEMDGLRCNHWGQHKGTRNRDSASLASYP